MRNKSNALCVYGSIWRVRGVLGAKFGEKRPAAESFALHTIDHAIEAHEYVDFKSLYVIINPYSKKRPVVLK